MRISVAAVVLCLPVLGGCIGHRQYRTSYETCERADPDGACPTSAVHRHVDDSGASDYVLGFVEFDDQGQLWDRKQMWAVLDAVYREVGERDVLLVVFVHGWKHCARDGDSNIEMFRSNLALLSEAEGRISAETGSAPRLVAGVYLGWRGGSVSVPVAKELTFWSRKSTAHRVGRGAVTEVLARLEQIKSLRAVMTGQPVEATRTKVVVVGHSFGGAVVYSAVAEALETGFVQTDGPAGVVGTARGFGDLVVLINPAFEALQYSPVSDMSTERGSYLPDQLPVIAILTSEADDATRRAFPIGRFFSTIFQHDRTVERTNGATRATESIGETSANRHTVGHFEPYRTHDLRAQGDAPAEDVAAQMVTGFYDLSEAWEDDTPGGAIEFPGSVLERRDTTAARNPYLVVRVDKEIIPDHNRIDDPRVVMFLGQLVLLSSQDDDPKVRSEMRAKGRKR